MPCTQITWPIKKQLFHYMVMPISKKTARHSSVPVASLSCSDILLLQSVCLVFLFTVLYAVQLIFVPVSLLFYVHVMLEKNRLKFAHIPQLKYPLLLHIHG